MYEELFHDVQKYLADNDGVATKSVAVPFRKRSEHIKRVYTWASRLIEGLDDSIVDKDAILVAVLFHDAGYATSVKGADHAEHSAAFFEKYAEQHGYSYAEK
jgi:HD superfamily phosphodiesterase